MFLNRLRDWKTALDLFQKMQEGGVALTHGMVQHLLLAVGKSGKSEDMLKVVFTPIIFDERLP